MRKILPILVWTVCAVFVLLITIQYFYGNVHLAAFVLCTFGAYFIGNFAIKFFLMAIFKDKEETQSFMSKKLLLVISIFIALCFILVWILE